MSNNPIEFYNRGEPYFEFTNFAEGYPINFPSLPGYENLAGSWATSEHLFQAAGFRDRPEIVERFRNCASAREAFNLKRQLFSEKQRLTDGMDGWDGTGSGSWRGDGSNAKKIEVMRLVVRQKFLQHEKLKEKLLETENREIIEDTAKASNPKERNNCWGNARGGKNWLGIILMEVRNEIITESSKNEPKKTKTPETTSPETEKPNSKTCAACGKDISNQETTYNSKGSSEKKKYFCSKECFKEGTNNSNNNKGNNKPDSDTPDNSNQNQDNQLRQKLDKAITEITDALNQNSLINDSELSNDYRNWKEKLATITDPAKVETFKNEVKADIEVQRKNKLAAEKVKNDIKNAQNKNGEELRQDLKNLKKGESNKSHQEQQEDIEKLSKKSAQEDPNSYRKMAVDLIKENLKENQIEESELEKIPEVKSDWKKINEEGTNQPEEIINAEKKINKKVNEFGAQKRFDKVLGIANQALKLGKKKQLKKALEEIVKFISSSNLYDQAIYSQLQQQKTLKELKSKLENYSVDKSNSDLSPKTSLWKKAIPISLLVILGGAVMITIIKIINMRKKRQKKKS